MKTLQQPKFNIGDIVTADDGLNPLTIVEIHCQYTEATSKFSYLVSLSGVHSGFSESRLTTYVAPRPTVMVEVDAEVAEHAARVFGLMCRNDWVDLVCRLNLSVEDDPIDPRLEIDGVEWNYAMFLALKAATDKEDLK